MEISVLGLSVIVIAWLVQLVYSWNGDRKINSWFIGIYLFGVSLLVLDGVVNSGKNSWIDLASFVVALALFFRVSGKKKKGK